MDYENVPDTSARSKYLKDCLFVSFQLGVSTRSTIVHHRGQCQKQVKGFVQKQTDPTNCVDFLFICWQ